MQDGKALQAGTSHFLGQNFARAQNIRFQDKGGEFAHAWTTSWGVSTRMIGGLIMVHGDDDGLRLPPAVAPHQIVIVPMLREVPEDEAVLTYARELRAELLKLSALGEPLRVHVDTKAGKGKRWSWVKKGAPLIIEVGGRDVAGGNVSLLRRDRLYDAGGKLASAVVGRADFVGQAAVLIEDIQAGLFAEAALRRDAAIVRVDDWAAIEAHFTGGEDKVIGWVEAEWSRPTGAALDAVAAKLKALKLTVRNTPVGAAAPTGLCVFTGDAAVERILIGRTY